VLILRDVVVLDDYEGLTALLTGSHSLRDNIVQHVYRDADWSTEDLFDRLGAFDASDTRFTLFLEGLASADVVPDVDTQRRFVDAVNPHLGPVGLELRETGEDGGYPVFSAVSTRSRRGNPKNLIFASTIKPDIRFRDEIDNDIEIVGNPDDVLVYDRRSGRRACGGVICRRGGRTPAILALTTRRSGRSIAGFSIACPPIHRRSATSTSDTTRSSGPACRICRRCCPRSGCTGTPRRSGSAAGRPYSGSAWTSCSCCHAGGGWCWR
jgi:hypothetical protein